MSAYTCVDEEKVVAADTLRSGAGEDTHAVEESGTSGQAAGLWTGESKKNTVSLLMSPQYTEYEHDDE